MTLNPDRLPVPDSLVTPLFTLRRQRPEDNAPDHEAVMASRDELRVWSDSEWPEDDFTLQANLEDLHMHIAEHDRDEAYGFSVFTPDGGTLLGSLYLNEVAPFRDHYHVSPAEQAALARAQVRVEYWLRSGTAEAFERQFLEAVRRWLAEAWWFDGVVYGSRRGHEARRAVYGAVGLRETARLISREGARRFYFHG